MPDKDKIEALDILEVIMEVMPDDEDIADWPEKAKLFAKMMGGIFIGLAAGIAINKTYFERLQKIAIALKEAPETEKSFLEELPRRKAPPSVER